jgi:ParB-like chromosome segregation protein Spo0J
MERPRGLTFRNIHVADKVFQWRIREDNLAADITHIRELERTIRDKRKPLDPLLVTAVGQRFYVVDGHHRLEAYRLAKWRTEIPVVYFEGDLKQAQAEAWRLNYKNKLPMTHRDKLEAAWRLVKEGGRTQVEISDWTTISVRTISTMLGVLKEHGDKARDVRWAVAKSLQWGNKDEQQAGEDYVEKKAHKWAKQIFKNLGPDALTSGKADVLARALEIVNPDLPGMLISEWREHVAEALGTENTADARRQLEPTVEEEEAWESL